MKLIAALTNSFAGQNAGEAPNTRMIYLYSHSVMCPHNLGIMLTQTGSYGHSTRYRIHRAVLMVILVLVLSPAHARWP